MQIMNLKNLVHTQLQGRDGQKYALSALLHHKLDLKQLFVHHDIIAPSQRASAPHYHLHAEELILVLSGNPVFVIDRSEHELESGDIFGIAAGDIKLHYIENRTQQDVELLVVKSSGPNEDRILYDETQQN